MAKLLRKALTGMLGDEQAAVVETGIDVIGEIAIVKLGQDAEAGAALVGGAILSSMKNVKAVFAQEGGLEETFA